MNKDGGLFTKEGLAPFDLIMFYTTGWLSMPADPKSGTATISECLQMAKKC